nr:MAG TPA: hypothetical protein [Caudoviricetes sp.]
MVHECWFGYWPVAVDSSCASAWWVAGGLRAAGSGG